MRFYAPSTKQRANNPMKPLLKPLVKWQYKLGWTLENFDGDYTPQCQLELLHEIPIWTLDKYHIPSLEDIFNYDHQIV